jgi:putative MFS transporter
MARVWLASDGRLLCGDGTVRPTSTGALPDRRSEAPIPDAEEGAPDPRYLRLLLVLLVSTAFFVGYDDSILGLLLPNIQSTFHASDALLGAIRIPVQVGAFAAFFVARLSDRIGRRTVMVWSIVGFIVFTTLTALSWDIWSFTVFQVGASLFLGAEYSVALTMVVEEFPRAKRGRALGVLLAFEALGTVGVGVLLAAGLASTSLSWRSFYLVGLLPLVVVAAMRPHLRETRRYVTEVRGRPAGFRVPFLAAWEPAWRGPLVLVGILLFLSALPSAAATGWWAEYAEVERGLSASDVGLFVVAAYVFGVFGYYCCGRLMERWGRRPTALTYGTLGLVAGILLFQTGARLESLVLLIVAVFFGLGIAPVMGAFATELFPTAVRGQSAAWLRNWFQVAGLGIGPALVGILGDPTSGAVGSIGDTVSLLMLVWAPALWLIWRYVPETRGARLEQITVGGRSPLRSGARSVAGPDAEAAVREPAR